MQVAKALACLHFCARFYELFFARQFNLYHDYILHWGAQWLSGRELDSRPRVRGFKPHRRHCVVVLEQDAFHPSLVLVQPRKAQPCLTERLLMGRKESNQTTKNIVHWFSLLSNSLLIFTIWPSPCDNGIY